MRIRVAFAAACLVAATAACSGSADPDPVPATEPAPSGLPTQVVQDARDVAGDLEQRQTELESMLP